MTPLLEVNNLATAYFLPDRTVQAVDEVSFTLDRGDSLALVGESGCGKTATAASIMQLIAPPGRIVGGSIRFAGEELIGAPPQLIRSLRGNRLAMIFQDPMTSLNPVLTIGEQIDEVLRLHRRMTRQESRQETIRLLGQVGIPAAEDRYRNFPHQLSGGMRQRVMIAMALACQPQLLLADEPTTALDVTIQAQILELLDTLTRDQNMALLLITHDLGIVAEHARRTAVMYAGRIVECGPTRDVLTAPAHPYTRGLLASLPQRNLPGQPLPTIRGSLAAAAYDHPGCRFHPRCPQQTTACVATNPHFEEIAPGHLVRCWHCR